jgi:hypothetical protein
MSQARTEILKAKEQEVDAFEEFDKFKNKE